MTQPPKSTPAPAPSSEAPTMRRPVSIPAPPPIPALSPFASAASAAAPPPDIDDDDLAKTLPIAPAARLPGAPPAPSRARVEPAATPTPPPSVPSFGDERLAARPSSPGDEGPASSSKKRSRRTLKIPDDAVPTVTPAPAAVAPASPPAVESAPEIEPEASWPSLDDASARAPEPAETATLEPATFEPIVPMRIITVASDLPAVESVRRPPVEEAPPHARSEATTIRITRDGDADVASPFPNQVQAPVERVERSPSTTRAGHAPEHAQPLGAEPAAEITPEPARVAPAAPDTVPSSQPPEQAHALPPPEPAPPYASPASPPHASPGQAAAARAELDDSELVEEVEPERMSLPVAPEGEVLLDFDDDQPKTSAPRKPPPPPPSSRKPPPTSAERPQVQRPQERPWWEELFGEDFLRTMDAVPERHVLREVDFIESSLGVESGGMLLDLACGDGRHAVELTARGYGVVGVDYSSAMLSRAAEHARTRGVKPTFAQGDMRDLAFEEAFDGAYSWDTSFGYFDDETNAAILRRLHKALRPGGVLLLDVLNREYVASRQPSLVWFEGDGCVCMDDMCVDFLTSRLRVKRTVMFDDGRSKELDYNIRLYALHELGKLLHDIGFRVIEVSGHLATRGVFFGSESPRATILAERD